MTLAVATVVENARSRHPGFDPITHPSGPVVRFLSSYQKELLSKIIGIDPSLVASEQTTALPLASFEDGIALPTDMLYFHGVVAVDKTHTAANPNLWPITLIPWSQRDAHNRPARAAWQHGGRLYLSGTASSWTQAGSIVISYVPQAAALTLAGNFAVPDLAEMVLESAAARFMALRLMFLGKMTAGEARIFTDDLDRAEATYLNSLVTAMGSQISTVEEVTPY